MTQSDTGQMNVTTDRHVIENWAEEHGAEPGRDSETNKPRLYFPDERDESVEESTWDDFFTQFEEENLAFYYDERETGSGGTLTYDLLDRNEAAQRATGETEAVKSALMKGDTITTTIRETRVIETEVVESDTVESTVVDSEVVEDRVIDEEVLSREMTGCNLADEDTIEGEMREQRRVTREVIENNIVESKIASTEILSENTRSETTGSEVGSEMTQSEGADGEQFADERKKLTERVEQELFASGIIDSDIVHRSSITSDIVNDDTVRSEVRERTVIEEEIEETKHVSAEITTSETIESTTTRSEVKESEIVESELVEGEMLEDEDAAPYVGETEETEHDEFEGGERSPFEADQIHADAFGYDDWNTDDEYIVFRNRGEETLELSGWTIENEDGHTYRFPEGFSVQPDERVTLYTGEGEDTETDLYWGSDKAIWKNDGDTITVKDDTDTVVFEETYS